MVDAVDNLTLFLSSGFELLTNKINTRARELLELFQLSTVLLPTSEMEMRYPTRDLIICLEVGSGNAPFSRQYSIVVIRPQSDPSPPGSSLPEEETIYYSTLFAGSYSCLAKPTQENGDLILSCLRWAIPYFEALSQRVVSENLYLSCVEVLNAYQRLWEIGGSVELRRGDYVIRMTSTLKLVLRSYDREGRLEILRPDQVKPILVLGVEDVETSDGFTPQDLVQLKGILSKELKVMLKG